MSDGKGRRILVVLVAGAALASGGCHDCSQDREVFQLLQVAQFNYQNQKFELSAQLFMNALEKCHDHYGAIVGLSNAFREYGNEQFRLVALHFRNEKPDMARQKYKKGNDLHADSERYLQKALQMEPEDLLPHYYLGLLWYQRATSPLDYPYRREDAESRQRDRDSAIEEFQLVVREVTQVYEAHRYLGLALFAANRTAEGIVHLNAFHDSRQKAFNYLVTQPARGDLEKERKERALREIEKEIADVRELIILHQGELVLQRDDLKAKESKGLDETERKRLAQISREMLLVQRLIRNFQVTQLAPHEEEVRQRCQDYLYSFNRGNPADVMSFVQGKRGDEAELKAQIRRKLESQTKYERVRYKSVIVSGELATVGFECNLVTPRGTRSNAEITLRWRLHGGQWMVYDHP